MVLACLLALAGCSGLSGTGDKEYVSGGGAWAEVAPGERGEPVDLQGEDLDGAPVDLAELRGKPVVINVWWSQCPPCRAEQPDLNDVFDELGEQVHFLGLNIRDASPDNARAYARRFEVAYPSLYSPDGQALLPFKGTLNPRSIPSTVILDAQGRIAASVQGALPSTQTLLSLVEPVLDE